MPQLRILHVITTLSAGGAEMMLCKLLSALPKEEFSNTVVALKDGGELEARARDVAHSVETLGMRNAAPNPFAFLHLWWIMRATRPHVVQTWLYHADLMGYIVGRATGVPAIAWNIRCSDMGDSYYRGVSGLVVRILSLLSPRPDAIVVNSAAGREAHTARGYASSRWHVIPNGFDLELFHPDPLGQAVVKQEIGAPVDRPLIGLVARFDPVKGHRTFLEAADILAKSYPDCCFALVGRGCELENNELNALVPSHLRANVLLLGHRNDIPKVTAAFDVATCASSFEGFPNVVGEAMACGVPCVVTDVGDSAEIVGETGIAVPPDDPQAMAEAWRGLLSGGKENRVRLGQAARDRIQSRYSLSQVSERYARLYRELASVAAPLTSTPGESGA